MNRLMGSGTALRIRLVVKRVLTALAIVLLCVVALAFLFPLVWLCDATFRPENQIFNVPPQLASRGFASFESYTLANIVKAFVQHRVWLAFLNSAFVTALGITLMLSVCSLAAYAFAFLEFPGKRVLFIVILATMMIPTTTMIVPFYRVMSFLRLTDNPLGLIITCAGSAFGLFLLRQYFIKIPRSFIESARMDGAGNVRVLARIILPLAKPALAALSIIQFRAIWNDFLNPMILLRTQEFYTLPIRIAVMDSTTIDKPYDAIIATGFLSALVPVVFFLVFQRKFIESLTGGLKQ